MSKKDKSTEVPQEPTEEVSSETVEMSVIPSPDSEWVELARNRRTQGVIFEKHILNKGTLRHPVTGRTINIDDEFVAKLKKNFDDGVCDIVQAPLADDHNSHSEAPDRNTGEVIDVYERDGKVFVALDARKHAEDFGKTLLGASAMLSTDYTNTKTGEKVGPTLLHVAVTNRPYVTGLEDYKELVAASDSSENTEVVVYSASQENEDPEILEESEEAADSLIDETLQASTPTEEIPMTRDELIAALREEHGIDVDALQTQAAEADSATELSNQLATELAETLQLSANSVDNATLVGAIAELANDKVTLSNRVEALEKDRARHVVKGLVEAGFIRPAQEEVFVELRLSNPAQFEKLIPEEPYVKLNNMVGSEQAASSPESPELDIDAEVSRYLEKYTQ